MAEVCQYALSPDVKMFSHEDGATILHMERGLYFALDRVGLLVLSAVLESDSAHSAITKLRQTFCEVDPLELARDVMDLIAQLTANNILVEEKVKHGA